MNKIINYNTLQKKINSSENWKYNTVVKKSQCKLK